MNAKQLESDVKELDEARIQPELNPDGYRYRSAVVSHTHFYLWPTLEKILREIPPPADIFEIGCGNGSNAHEVSKLGYRVVGIDSSTDGIAIGKAHFPDCRLESGSAYDELAATYGTFDAVISFEVVEHLFYPRKFAASMAALLKPGAIGIVSTPYHGYAKNLALALFGKMDAHHSPLWDYGHIKFWSKATLVSLFKEVGLVEKAFYRVGRIAPLAKSMILVVQKP
jgi:2-polyprenyl-3-methyl-5-hydroxy-6-metoxy-1,4-benzoquinol methylase